MNNYYVFQRINLSQIKSHPITKPRLLGFVQLLTQNDSSEFGFIPLVCFDRIMVFLNLCKFVLVAEERSGDLCIIVDSMARKEKRRISGRKKQKGNAACW